MTLYRLKNSTMTPERAVQWDGTDRAYEQIEECCDPFPVLRGVFKFARANPPASGGNCHLLLADTYFPVWIERGDWITRNGAGDVDIWPESVFADKFEAVEESAPAKPLPVSDYVTKDSPAARAGAFQVQAMRYTGTAVAEIQADDWAAFADELGWHLAEGLGFLDSRRAFPIDRGAGLMVQPGCWIIRFPSCSVEIMDDATFQAMFQPVAAPAMFQDPPIEPLAAASDPYTDILPAMPNVLDVAKYFEHCRRNNILPDDSELTAQQRDAWVKAELHRVIEFRFGFWRLTARGADTVRFNAWRA